MAHSPRGRRTYGRSSSSRSTQRKPKPSSIFARIFTPAKLLFVLIIRIFGYTWRAGKQTLQRIARKHNTSISALILKFGGISAIIGIIGIVGLFFWMSKDLPDPDHLTEREIAESTKIYDRTGEHLLYEIFADEKRTIVEFEEIPQHLIDGIIATEDTKFYEHHGVRPLSILRAVLYSFQNKRIAGTSTLTQQLVKNAILTDERKISRKLKEIILSIRLEQKYSKDQILKIYFNEIPYGSTNYGVEAAAQSYFGKSVSELDLQESATLAGMPKAPSTYLSDKEALKNRRDFVLERMFQEGKITREEADEAQEHPVTLALDFGDIEAEHFVLYVKKLLGNEFGEKQVETGGLTVRTSLDWEKQQIAETVMDELAEEVLTPANADNAALVALDPKTGHILAMLGSRDFYDADIHGQFNVVTLGRRQPGSSFKPIVYAGNFEQGYTPDTVLFDVVTNFDSSGSGTYTPLNYDLKEHGPVTIRQALQGSLNIPAVKALYLLGDKHSLDFAERLGYTTMRNGDYGLSLVLGGAEVSMLEHAGAYATFANRGSHLTPSAILSVTDPSGDVLYEWKPNPEQVIKQDVADTITSVLQDDDARAYAFGRGGILTLPERAVAAKTGTTNNYKDAWTIGYTPSLVTAVWAGRTDNKSMNPGFGGSRVAGPIWNEFMRRALENSPAESFPEPPPNDAEKPVLRGSQGGNITLAINRVTGKRATSSTPEQYVVMRSYIQPHSILHYVDPQDPRGAAPSNPAANPQYQAWEAAISDWIARRKAEDENWEVSFEAPPADFDDAYSLEMIPSLTVVSPQPSSTIFADRLITDIRASAPRGVQRVIYTIDGRLVSIERSHPFNLDTSLERFEEGPHILSVTVEDDIGNRLEEVIPFILERKNFFGEISEILSTSSTPLSTDEEDESEQ